MPLRALLLASAVGSFCALGACLNWRAGVAVATFVGVAAGTTELYQVGHRVLAPPAPEDGCGPQDPAGRSRD